MKEILLALGEPALRRVITDALEGLPVVLRDKPEGGAAPALIVADPASLPADMPKGVAPAPLILCSGPLSRPQLAACVSRPGLRALVARDVPTTAQALAAAASELLGGPRAPTPGSPFRATLASSHDREEVLGALSAHLGEAGIRARAVGRLINAVEELITNAVYDAPTDATGQRLYADVDRRMAVFLGRAGQTELHVSVSDGLVHARMRDPFGSLEAESVQSFLAQGLRGDFADKAGGAGLGFLRIYALVDALEVRVVKGAMTEVSIRVDANRPRRDPGARPNDLLLVDRAPDPG